MTEELRAQIDEARELALMTLPQTEMVLQAVRRIEEARAACLKADEHSQAYALSELESKLLSALFKCRRAGVVILVLGQQAIFALLEALPVI